MFFLTAEFARINNLNEFFQLPGSKIAAAKINFSGSVRGSLFVFLPQTLALSITADFLGDDPENISKEKIIETVKEILNMIAGGAFSKYDNSKIFNLDIPEMVNYDGVEKDGSNSGKEILLGVKTIEESLALRMDLMAEK